MEIRSGERKGREKRLNISKTVPARGSVPIDHQQRIFI